MAHFALKASQSDSSTAIIQSFHRKWYEPLSDGEVSIVFRKLRPKSFSPTLMYAYIAKPISAIVARMAILDCQLLSVDDAVRFVKEGQLTEQELRAYATGYSEIVVYRIGNIAMASTNLERAFLFDQYDFFPHPNFIALSGDGVQTLDRLANFRASTN